MVGRVHKKYARGVRERTLVGDGLCVNRRHPVADMVVCVLGALLIGGLIATLAFRAVSAHEQGRAEGIAQVQTIVDHANAKTAAAEQAMADALVMQDASLMAIRLARETLTTCGELGHE